MKKTKLPCGAEVTAEVMKEGEAPIGVDITIFNQENVFPDASFFIAGSSLKHALDFFEDVTTDYLKEEEETKCTS